MSEDVYEQSADNDDLRGSSEVDNLTYRYKHVLQCTESILDANLCRDKWEELPADGQYFGTFAVRACWWLRVLARVLYTTKVDTHDHTDVTFGPCSVAAQFYVNVETTSSHCV